MSAHEGGVGGVVLRGVSGGMQSGPETGKARIGQAGERGLGVGGA